MTGLTHPTFLDAQAAARRLSGKAVRTPLLESPKVNDLVGGRILVKAESLQRTGSFKFRGAYNRIAQLNVAERQAGIVAYSGGNHAQGAAAAAQLLSVDAIILMPEDAPQIKIQRTKSYGARIIFYNRWTDDRDIIAARLIGNTGRTLVPSFDDPHIIAGQATVGLEISEQAHEMGVQPESVLVCCGGGGLTAGIGMVLKHLDPAIQIYSVEPDAFDDTRRSLLSGRREANSTGARSICDALLTQLGELTFSMNRRLLSGGITVSDQEVCRAMLVAFEELKLVLEPGGAVALAAVLSGKADVQGRTIVVVATGGNVDADLYCQSLVDGRRHEHAQ